MYNQGGFNPNRNPYSVVYRQPPTYNYPVFNSNIRVQPAPRNQSNNLEQRYQDVQPVEGILIEHQYEPEKGDPMVLDEAVFKGEIIKVGDKRQEIVNENEAVMVGDGYISQDGKKYQIVHHVVLTVFKFGKLEIKNVTKVKARFESSLIQHKILKVTSSGKDYYVAFRDHFQDWFLRLVWAKLIIQKKDVSEYGNWNDKVAGKIFKKTKILGDWEPKFVTIDSKSLRCSKSSSRGQIDTEIVKTKQIWTRFDQIRGGYYLIVKLWNGILKEQFAVPTMLCLNWLYHFLKLLSME